MHATFRKKEEERKVVPSSGATEAAPLAVTEGVEDGEGPMEREGVSVVDAVWVALGLTTFALTSEEVTPPAGSYAGPIDPASSVNVLAIVSAFPTCENGVYMHSATDGLTKQNTRIYTHKKTPTGNHDLSSPTPVPNTSPTCRVHVGKQGKFSSAHTTPTKTELRSQRQAA